MRLPLTVADHRPFFGVGLCWPDGQRSSPRAPQGRSGSPAGSWTGPGEPWPTRWSRPGSLTPGPVRPPDDPRGAGLVPVNRGVWVPGVRPLCNRRRGPAGRSAPSSRGPLPAPDGGVVRRTWMCGVRPGPAQPAGYPRLLPDSRRPTPPTRFGLDRDPAARARWSPPPWVTSSGSTSGCKVAHETPSSPSDAAGGLLGPVRWSRADQELTDLGLPAGQLDAELGLAGPPAGPDRARGGSGRDRRGLRGRAVRPRRPRPAGLAAGNPVVPLSGTSPTRSAPSAGQEAAGGSITAPPARTSWTRPLAGRSGPCPVRNLDGAARPPHAWPTGTGDGHGRRTLGQ